MGVNEREASLLIKLILQICEGKEILTFIFSLFPVAMAEL